MNFIYPKCIIMTNINNEKKFLSNIEKAGRVCYKSENKITDDSYRKFIKNAIKLGHHSIIEHQYITVKFIVNRGILAEITRHRLANYCLSGDTIVHAYHNKQSSTGKRSGPGKKWSISQLFDYSNDYKRKGRLKLIKLRSVDDNGIIVPGEINSIIFSGNQLTYTVITKSGRSLRATENHKFLTPNGWKKLSELSAGDKVIANGISPLDNKEWLYEQYIVLNKTRKEVAKLAGCCETYIYKAFKKFDIVKPLSDRPNRKAGYGRKGMFTDQQRKDISLRMSGKNSPSWKGDNIGLSGGYIRASKIYTPDICWGCNIDQNLHRHHIDHNPINNSKDNILFLCEQCHKAFHFENVITVFNDEIVSITPFKIEPTYDIEMKNEPHNFVANGLVVHNSVESTRYCKYNNDDMTYIIPLWATNILEGKYDDLNDAMKKIKCLAPCEREYVSILEDISDSYDNLTVEYEWKAEMARDILPNALKTEIVMTANLREWRHILDLRTTQCCHPQMKELMFPLLEEFNKKLPTIFEDVYSKKIDEYKNKKYNTKIKYDLGE